MKYRTFFAILLLALILTGCTLWPFGKQEEEKPIDQPTATPTIDIEKVKGVKEELELKTKTTLPTDAEQTVLRDVSGSGGSGIATRKWDGLRYEHTILADLPNLKAGEFYASWLVKGQPTEAGFNLRSSGKLKLVKGGWVLDFTSGQNLMEHSGVVVTRETRDDSQPEAHMLEGSF
jgi:hypothetical protein